MKIDKLSWLTKAIVGIARKFEPCMAELTPVSSHRSKGVSYFFTVWYFTK